MKILDDRQIRQKIRRIAIEILERNFGESEIVLAGLNNNGMGFARFLMDELTPLAPKGVKLSLTRIRLNPANPVEYDPVIEMSADDLRGKPVIIVDDVANTGRTIFYAVQPLLRVIPKKVEVAVLVDRKHKSFPVKADYVGLSLATTLLEDIDVRILDVREMAVHLN
ncbi:MAG: phosphoribosyltransferase [Saprospiraceae bacterium]|nr:phosphoribosyltransferase [Saprospiraceae bacterium]MCB0574914.1 phosphoribosyltransferase [Saprospiraceae bacterium]MCB9307166.1 phosphoribosyltransferase [Lewinellaceae bacterium]MCB9353849.1 phosphoribosyltransferase [Lewinellaceae bacterium]